MFMFCSLERIAGNVSRISHHEAQARRVNDRTSLWMERFVSTAKQTCFDGSARNRRIAPVARSRGAARENSLLLGKRDVLQADLQGPVTASVRQSRPPSRRPWQQVGARAHRSIFHSPRLG